MSAFSSRGALAAAAYLGMMVTGHAQTPLPGLATPFPRAAPVAAATPFVRPLVPGMATPAPLARSFGVAATPAIRASLFASTPVGGVASPPRDVPLVEKKKEELSNQEFSSEGEIALAIDPEKWKHAETDNFIVHYRRSVEALKVVREVEYDLWYVATTLGATKDRYTKKSHVFVFKDEEEWKEFLDKSDSPKWSASFARGDELFLNVRGAGNSGFGASFDSHTLAHETTHAVIARIFPGKRWPLWLNEGFAEYMGGASVGARKNITAKRFARNLDFAEMPLEQLGQVNSYPNSELAITQLYQTSEKFVRFLMTELPKDRILKYVDTVVAGASLQDAFLKVYGDKIKDWPTFQRRYERFTK